MSSLMFPVYTLIMIGTTIAIYESFRRSGLLSWLIMIIDKNVILQVLFNFGISSIIKEFTGEGSAAGAANLCASLLFPIYVLIRNKINPEYKKPSVMALALSVVLLVLVAGLALKWLNS